MNYGSPWGAAAEKVKEKTTNSNESILTIYHPALLESFVELELQSWLLIICQLVSFNLSF